MVKVIMEITVVATVNLFTVIVFVSFVPKQYCNNRKKILPGNFAQIVF